MVKDKLIIYEPNEKSLFKSFNTSALLESSVRVTLAPTLAATKPGKEVPAPSCKLHQTQV